MPAPKDHRGKGDEPAPGRHVLVERADRPEGEIGATKAGDQPAEEHVDIAGAIDVDPNSVGGLWMLADGATAKAPACPEKTVGHRNNQQVHDVNEDVLVEEDSPDHRDVTQEWNLDRSEDTGSVVLGRVLDQQLCA